MPVVETQAEGRSFKENDEKEKDLRLYLERRNI